MSWAYTKLRCFGKSPRWVSNSPHKTADRAGNKNATSNQGFLIDPDGSTVGAFPRDVITGEPPQILVHALLAQHESARAAPAE